ncbi:MAG: NAD(P)/FAD-dependent oxidoreductase [Polyangiaceae bacterium]
MSRRELDVAILGNGAVGCALALRLNARHPGARIAIVGPSRRPDCASLAAGAMLSAFAEIEAGAQLESLPARRKLEAAVEASRMWDGHVALLNSRLASVEPLVLNKGTHMVSSPATEPLDDQNLDAIIGQLTAFREPFREVDPQEIPGIAPLERSRPRRAIYIENEGCISAKHLHRAYDEAFRLAPGVAVVDAEVTSIDADGPAKLVNTSSGETLAAPHVVLAAGVRTQKLIEQLRLEKKIPRIVFGVGVSLVLRSSGAYPRKVFRSPNRGSGGGVYVVPYDDGYCYLGATSLVSVTEAPLPQVRAVRDLLTLAMEQVNGGFAEAQIHKTLLGYRPTTLDAFPLFGRTSIEGVWVASGTRRDGLHLSPKAAEELVTAIDTGSQPFAGAFTPERPLILDGRLGREHGIPVELLDTYRDGYVARAPEAPSRRDSSATTRET